MNKFPRSAYVHIPFCHRRCFYCDFAVIPLGNNIESLNGYGSKTVKEYLTFLNREILSIKHKSPLSTIYIGGGTPSILNPLQIKDLIDGIGKYVEFTVVETDKKGGKYRIINCFPSEEPQDSIIKTIKTNYKLNN